MRILLLACVLSSLLGTAGAHPHSAPTLWVDLEIGDGFVLCDVTGVREILHPWFGISPDAEHPLPGAEQRKAIQGALDYFRGSNPVTIDGVPAEARVEFLGRPDDLEGVEAIQYMRLKLVFPCEGWPRRVDFEWVDFEGALWQSENIVPVLLKYGNEVSVANFSTDEPGFSWHSESVRPQRRAEVEEVAAPGEPTGIPLLSIALMLVGVGAGFLLRTAASARIVIAFACAIGAGLLWDDVRVATPWQSGPALPSNEQARRIFEQLHRNIYAAFDASTEDGIYELLAVSVDARLLDELYVEIYESLILRDAGGAVCRIKDVEVLGGHVDLPEGGDQPSNEFSVRWEWRVTSSITHWGHTHGRVNSYEAIYTVRHDGKSWKIAAVDVQAHERIDDKPQPRSVDDDPLSSIERIR